MAECAQCRFLQGAVFAGEELFFEKSCIVCLHSVSYRYQQSIYSMIKGCYVHLQKLQSTMNSVYTSFCHVLQNSTIFRENVVSSLFANNNEQCVAGFRDTPFTQRSSCTCLIGNEPYNMLIFFFFRFDVLCSCTVFRLSNSVSPFVIGRYVQVYCSIILLAVSQMGGFS